MVDPKFYDTDAMKKIDMNFPGFSRHLTCHD